MKVLKKLNWKFFTWLSLACVSVIVFFVVTGFIVFPQKFTLPLAVILVVIVAIMGVFSFRNEGKKKKKRKTPIIITNCVLSFVLIVVSIYLPILSSQMKGLFVEPSNIHEIRMNAYVMTSEYKSNHEGFSSTDTSEDLHDYLNSAFITQSKVDKDNQAYAVEEIKEELAVDAITTIEKSDIPSALAALYDGSGDVLILNETYESLVSELPGYENFKSDTQVLYTVVKTEKLEATPTPEPKDITNTSFMVFIAGSDSRSASLTEYTRTDVDLLLTVDPVNKQLLLISMPRDWYVRNPALYNAYDKLTHLGNNGMQNSIDGLNQEYGFDYIKDYFMVNFVTFKNIVDSIDGIDVNNPYAFSSESGYSYEEGLIHLYGNEALAYVRERHNLSNGDYGRNEHQSIVLEAIIKKMASSAIISNFNSLLNGLQGNFLTSLSSDDIYKLANQQLNSGGSWNFYSYHLGGMGDYNTTISMGDMQLYVSYPIEDQVMFAKEQMRKVMNGEIITQETLPSENETVFLPN